MTKNETPVTRTLSDETNFPNNLLLTDRQVTGLLGRKYFLKNQQIVNISFFIAEIDRPAHKLLKICWGHVKDHETLQLKISSKINGSEVIAIRW